MGPPDPNLGRSSPCVRPIGAYEPARGGLGDLAVSGQFGVKNDPTKKVSKRVWGYFGGVFMMFSGPADLNLAL